MARPADRPGRARPLPRLALGAARLAVDVRADAAYWARATGRGKLLAWGCVPYRPGEAPEEAARRLAAGERAGRRGVEVALRSADAEHRRLDLPAIPAREGAAVGRRRAVELAAERAGDACSDFSQAPGSAARPLWLCAAPLPQVAALQEWWRSAGVELACIASHHLALAALARLLPDLGEDLEAIVEVEAEQANCVVVDRHGWLFGRQIPLRFASDTRLQDRDDPDGLSLDAEEESFTLAERVTTELERTLRYVQSVLGLGSVARVALAGEAALLGELSAALETNLELPVQPIGDLVAEGPAAGVDPRAALAIGIALAGGELNLLPEAARAKRAQGVLKRRLRRGLAASLAGAALLALGSGVQLVELERRLGALEAEWRATTQERRAGASSAAARERATALDAGLAALDRDAPSFVATLDALGRLAPATAVVHELRVVPDAGAWRATLAVEASGASVSEAADAVSRLARALGESPLFAVESTARTPLPRLSRAPDGAPRVRFAIEARVAPVAAAAARRAADPDASHG